LPARVGGLQGAEEARSAGAGDLPGRLRADRGADRLRAGRQGDRGGVLAAIGGATRGDDPPRGGRTAVQRGRGAAAVLRGDGPRAREPRTETTEEDARFVGRRAATRKATMNTQIEYLEELREDLLSAAWREADRAPRRFSRTRRLSRGNLIAACLSLF